MTNYEFLKKYQRLQEGIAIDKIIDLGFASIGFSLKDKSSFWNLAIVNTVVNDSQIALIEDNLIKLQRNPTIYFEDRPDLSPLANLLEGKGYKKSFADAWQFWKGEVIDESHFSSVKKVDSEEMLQTYLKTFNECYLKDDPQNPYGELGEYLQTAEDAWHKHNGTGRLEYFIAYKADSPVAVSALTNFEGLGYISNVGTLPGVRGEGFGKLITHYCVFRSIENGNTEHCLATEEGEYPNEFYKRIGFETRFNALAYTKDQRSARILNELKSRYPGKDAYDLDGRGMHFVCEVEPVSEHPEYDKAVEVMIESRPHKHLKMVQNYTILRGNLELHLDDNIIKLKTGDKYTVLPNTVHWAKSDNECWVEIYSKPGWTKEDHIIV